MNIEENFDTTDSIDDIDFNFIEENKEIKQIFNATSIDSKIATHAYESDKMKEWIGYDCELFLLYRGTRDGKSATSFHDKCDNQGNTIGIIHTKDGSRFGGYTDLQWDIQSSSLKGVEKKGVG